ncbi:MAG: hypothetical protein KatS3mg111_2523 [Pirellulaceae bacterium]|nr:MAG: hypothetical protein KatS3mg111_2523 [Pirellulaceae bacterium]
MQNFNFFQWIREGVRQSVLLGVSDAVEQLGVPDEVEAPHPVLANLLQEAPGGTSSARLAGPAKRKSPPKKRLGKSLKDISADTP